MDVPEPKIRAGEALMRLAKNDPETLKGILAAQASIRAFGMTVAVVCQLHSEAMKPVHDALARQLAVELAAINAKSDREVEELRSLMVAQSNAAKHELCERGFPVAAWTLETWCRIAKIVDVDPGNMTLGEIVEAAVVWSERERIRARYVAKEVAAALPGPAAESSAVELSFEARALALLVQHPDWSVTKIAEEVGCSRQTLYDYELFKQARAALKAGRADLPRGFKGSETGELEAWDDD